MASAKELIKQNALFHHFDDTVIQALIDCSEEREYGDGEGLIYEGDLSEELFFILEGQVLVRHAIGGDLPTNIVCLKTGEVVGEMVLVDHGPRSADVTADGPVKVLAWKAARLRELCYEHPKFGLNLLSGIAELLCKRIRQSNKSIAVLNTILWGSQGGTQAN